MKFSLVAFFFFIGIHNAYAYLDPGSGSLIIQSTIAAIAGFFYVIKTYFHTLRDKFLSKKNKHCAKQDKQDEAK